MEGPGMARPHMSAIQIAFSGAVPCPQKGKIWITLTKGASENKYFNLWAGDCSSNRHETCLS
jgi:hypothetical protein